MPGLAADDVRRALKDVFYVTVGFGVIAFQRAQVQRRGFQERLNGQCGDISKLLDERVKTIEERLDAFEEQVGTTLDRVESRLPDTARSASRQFRLAAKDARTQLRHLSVARPTG